MKAGSPGTKVLVMVGNVLGRDGMPTIGVMAPSVPVTDEVKGKEPKGIVVVTIGAMLNA